MHTLVTTRSADAPRPTGFGSRLLFRLFARDRDPREFCLKTEDRRAGTGRTRFGVEPDVIRDGGRIDLPLRALSGW